MMYEIQFSTMQASDSRVQTRYIPFIYSATQDYHVDSARKYCCVKWHTPSWSCLHHLFCLNEPSSSDHASPKWRGVRRKEGINANDSGDVLVDSPWKNSKIKLVFLIDFLNFIPWIFCWVQYSRMNSKSNLVLLPCLLIISTQYGRWETILK